MFIQPAGMSDYGAKASADLIVTRGKGFTKEKNKKKRCVQFSFLVLPVEASSKLRIAVELECFQSCLTRERVN